MSSARWLPLQRLRTSCPAASGADGGSSASHSSAAAVVVVAASGSEEGAGRSPRAACSRVRAWASSSPEMGAASAGSAAGASARTAHFSMSGKAAGPSCSDVVHLHRDLVPQRCERHPSWLQGCMLQRVGLTLRPRWTWRWCWSAPPQVPSRAGTDGGR